MLDQINKKEDEISATCDTAYHQNTPFFLSNSFKSRLQWLKKEEKQDEKKKKKKRDSIVQVKGQLSATGFE